MIPIKGEKSTQIYFNWPEKQKRAYFCFYTHEKTAKEGPMSAQSADLMAKYYLREGRS